MGKPWNRPDAAGVSDLDRLRTLVAHKPTLGTTEALASFPERSFRSVQFQIALLRTPDHPLQPLIHQFTRHHQARPPQSKKPLLDDQLRLPGPSALVLSDIHIPFQHADFIEQCVDLACAWGVQDVVLNGDTFDIEAFAKWEGDPDDLFEEEMTQGEEMLSYLAGKFARVVISIGNHEQRLLGKTMKRQLKATRFLRLFNDNENVEISAWEWTEMDSPQGLWRFIHPMNASVISGRVPAIIASRRFTDSHVIGAHGHLKGQVRTEDGKRWALDSGCCCDPRRIGYVTMRVGNRPVMNVGAVIVKDGFPYALEPASHWEALRRMYPPAISLQRVNTA